MNLSNKLLVLAGPSGTGKTTLARRFAQSGQGIYFPATTTRPPRPDEVRGNDYNFVDVRTFVRLVENGEMCFSDELFGHKYGVSTALDEVTRTCPRVILVVPTWRVRDIQARYSTTLVVRAVHFLAESESVLVDRLTERDRLNAREVSQRLADATDQNNAMLLDTLRLPPSDLGQLEMQILEYFGRGDL